MHTPNHSDCSFCFWGAADAKAFALLELENVPRYEFSPEEWRRAQFRRYIHSDKGKASRQRYRDGGKAALGYGRWYNKLKDDPEQWERRKARNRVNQRAHRARKMALLREAR